MTISSILPNNKGTEAELRTKSLQDKKGNRKMSIALYAEADFSPNIATMATVTAG
jgi:hypothetical protein